MLLRLVYISKSLLAGDPREREHIADILMTSRRRNADAEVTGALLATDRCFAQVLEGDREAVEATFDRITRDPRHREILCLLMAPIAKRHFPDWAMAYICPSQSAEEAVARVTQSLPDSDTGDAGRELVTAMSGLLETCDGGPSAAGNALP